MRLPIRSKMILFIGLPTVVIFVAELVWMLGYARRQTMLVNEGRLADIAETAAARFDEYISKAARVADTTARAVSRVPALTERQVYGLLRDTVRLNQRVYGAAMAFEPGTFNQDDSLFCPYVYEDRSKPGEVAQMDITREVFDWYRDEKWEWWHRAKNENRGIWTRPYFDEGAGNIVMVTYSAPFHATGTDEEPGAFRGVTTVDIDLETLQEEIGDTIAEGHDFYILAPDGGFVYSPDPAVIMTKTIFEVLAEKGRIDLDEMARGLLNGETGRVTVSELLGAGESIVARAEIPSTGWVFVTTRTTDEAMAGFRQRRAIGIAASGVALILILGSILFISGRLTRPIGRLRERVGRIADGAAGESVEDVRTGDEIEELAGAFTAMQRKVADREASLENARETTLTQLLESAPDAMIVADTTGAIRRSNGRVSELFGYDRDELAEMNVTALMPERFRERHGSHLAAYFENPAAREMGQALELLGLRKDGTEFPLEIGLSPFHDPEGLMAVAAIRDITERRMVEIELRKLNQTVEQGSAIVVITDPDGDIEYVNPRFTEVTGYAPDEVLGRNPRLLKSGAQDAAFYRELWETLTEGREWRGEFCNRKKDGTVYWASAAISPIRDAKGVTTHFVAIEDDVTAQKEAAEQLELQEERYRTLVANLPETVFRCRYDDDWTMQFISEDVTRLTGYPPDEFVQNAVRTFDSVIHPEDRAPVADEVDAAVRDGAPWLLEYRVLHADGSVRWAEERGRAVSGDGDEVEYLDGVIADVTERKAMEEELLVARQQAEAANQAKSDFLSHMSHELRTPLNGVLGYAQILQRDPAATRNQKESLDAIVSCGSHLLSLINDVLDLSKIEAGRLEVDEAPTDLARLLKNVGDVVAPRARTGGLSFDTDVSPEVPQGVVTDAAKVRQILVNLLGNAVKFTSEGGVTLRVTEAPKGRLRFEVADTGVGMTEKERAVIFDPFKQVEAGKVAGGTGLGLAITRRLVERLDGRIDVESEPGKGSTFIIELPLVEADTEDLGSLEAEEELHAGDAVLAPGQTCTVLVADDRKTNRDILERMLETTGIVPLVADDGDTALEMLQAHDEIDLVLMDVRMPRLNGIEVVKRLRADPNLKDMKVIAVTASVFPEFRQKAIEAGFDDFLGKPFRTGELIRKLKKHLDVEFVEEEAAADEETAGGPEGELSPEIAADAARRIRDAVEMGNLTALDEIAAELAATPGAAALGARIGEFARSIDFDGLARLAGELEG